MAGRMSEHWRERLGRFGVWRAANQVTPDLAASLEELGYGAVWLGGSPSADLLAVDGLLAASTPKAKPAPDRIRARPPVICLPSLIPE